MSTDRSWPDPPEPGALVDLPIAAPEVLLDALGYRGDDQHVAIFRGPQGAVWLDDGLLRDGGDLLAWHRFASHPVAEPLARYDLGGAGRDATQWLLVDRDTNQLRVGHAGDVAEVLAGQPHTRDRFTGLRTIERTLGRAVHPDVRAARAPTGPGWQAEAARAGRLLDALTRALDGSQVQQHAADVVAGIGALSARTSTQLHRTPGAGSTAEASSAGPGTSDSPDGARMQPVAAWSSAEADPAGGADRHHGVELS
ncbi:hypothetical protein AB0H83_29790 [Dactylosporangium sp. NPDC050688]|uniref:hypothetical protein n=1 Tax=Dactylosporangium sp. NPDC050688 TaxID=3157217 RepID=UPI0033D2F222